VARKLSCKYPPAGKQRASLPPVPVGTLAALQVPKQLQPNLEALNLADMRLFHHFVVIAYPCLPMGNDHVWVKAIPPFAHRVRWNPTLHRLLPALTT